jgi:hypothetical protein
MLSTLAPSDLANAIALQRHRHAVSRARRASGKKVAVRIVTELQATRRRPFAGEATGADRAQAGAGGRGGFGPRRPTRSRRWSISAIRATIAANAVAAAHEERRGGRRFSAKLIRLGLKELAR